jgi:sulfite oxidase
MSYRKIFKYTIFGSTIPVSYLFYNYFNEKKKNLNQEYSSDQLIKFNNFEQGIYVSYKDDVYNITNFVKQHPGGESKIMLAAGKAIDPYWKLYPQHLPHFKTILEPLKIGKLTDYNPKKYDIFENIYLNEPIRNGNLKYHNVTPCNAEAQFDNQLQYITPNEDFYIRNHHPVPIVEGNPLDYKIDLLNNKKQYSIQELIDTYKVHNITVSLQCGGNRRKQLNQISKTSGTSWDIGAMSTAVWSGIKLSNLLQEVPINKEKFVNFTSIDGLQVSIPISKALEPSQDVLLAYKMNGEQIPPDHGYPLRLIVPGYVGIRNIKWLKTIEISEEEVSGNWQQGIAYKQLPPNIKDVSRVDLKDYQTTYEMPVQSCIVYPKSDDEIIIDSDGNLTIKGYAWSGGGRNIIRVDLSIDDGKTWEQATLTDGKNQEYNRAWAWTLWEYKINLKGQKKLKIICKAADSSYNTQPEKKEQVWNVRGINNNSWHSVEINNKK